MGEGVELLVWGVVIAFLWLRGLAKQAQRAREREALEAAESDDPVPAEVEAPARTSSRSVEPGPDPRSGVPDRRAGESPHAGASRRSRSESSRTRSATREVAETGGRGGIRAQWAEITRRIEEQMEAQQEAARRTVEEAERGEEDQEAVVIPGRRVVPRSGDAVEPRPSTMPVRRLADPIPPGDVAPGRPDRIVPRSAAAPRRPAGRGSGDELLGRLDRYTPFQRAIILSELLGPPLATKDDPPVDESPRGY
ncbi:MAG: hypothetical protein MJB57_15395 [Gemmatimonadetes bacterium]|nr:hypothetical protein [Gemmatimonadota bacterium]